MSYKDIPLLIRKFFPNFADDYICYEDAFLEGQKEIYRLKSENSNLEHVINGVNSLILNGNKILGIRKTKNKEYVLVYEAENCESYKFHIYVAIPFLSRTKEVVRLVTTLYEATKSVKINDIIIDKEADTNKGYGSIALEYLINKAKKEKIKRIYGRITEEDYKSHGDRLMHFYKKFGFHIGILQDGKREINLYL